MTASGPTGGPLREGPVRSTGTFQPERMNSPLVRKGAEGLVRATGRRALEKIAEGLGAVKQKYGPDGIGGICSGRLTTRETTCFRNFCALP